MLDVIVATTTCQPRARCEYGAAAAARWSRMRMRAVAGSSKSFSDGVGNVVNFSHAFFGLMMHLRSPAPAQASAATTAACRLQSQSQSQSRSRLQLSSKNAATCKRQQLEKAIVTVYSFNVNYKNKQQLTQGSSSSCSFQFPATSCQLRPSQSTIFGFEFLCTPSNYARFPMRSFCLRKILYFLHTIFF